MGFPHLSSSSTPSASSTPLPHAPLPSTMPLPNSSSTTTFSSSAAAYSSVLISMNTDSTTISAQQPRTSSSTPILPVFLASSWHSLSSSSSTAPLTSGLPMVSILYFTKTSQPLLTVRKLVFLRKKMKILP